VNPAVFGLAALLGAVATLGARALAPALGLVSKPNPIVAQHVKPIACLGGLGVATGSLLALALAARGTLLGSAHLLGPALLFLGLGILDDRKPLTPIVKLVAQAGIALVAVLQGAVGTVTGNPLVDGLLSFAWIVGIVNAFNVLDVCDGLVAGVAALFFAAVAIASLEARTLALALCGACVGFLAFNRPRATIFLGDGGSHYLGFLAAALALAPGARAVGVRDAAAMLLALALPIFETAFLIYARTARGLPWWRGSRDHFALRLQAAGWSTWKTVLTAWAIAGTLAALGLALEALPTPAAWAALAAVLLVAVAVGGRLARSTEPALPRR
jgi:UDP-GlcNAc:undecaprenyl-phosphate GlcNAc-1-phosphate transferase